MDQLRMNIRHLMAARNESENATGTESGVGQTWLHRFLKGEIRKSNQEKVLLLARHFGVSAAQLRDEDLTRTPASAASHPAGLEREIVGAAVKLVAYMQDLAIKPFPAEDYPDLLYVAMQVVRDEIGPQGVLDGTNLVDASKRFAARLRATG